MSTPLPHITVQVEYNGETVSEQGAQFIDAIGFLVRCEEVIRRNKGLKEPVDVTTTAIQHENMRNLLGIK